MTDSIEAGFVKAQSATTPQEVREVLDQVAEQLFKDAERYRWLRDKAEHWNIYRPGDEEGSAIKHDVWSVSSRASFDAAIDAAMKEQQR